MQGAQARREPSCPKQPLASPAGATNTLASLAQAANTLASPARAANTLASPARAANTLASLAQAASALAALALALAALAAGMSGCWRKKPGDATAGEMLFRQRCALCHATGVEGGQGPGLGGIVGRKAGAGPGFGYSPALKASGLTWDTPTLDRFLAAPGGLVPGTTMALATPSEGERRDLVAFLATLAAHPAASAPRTASPGASPAASPGLRAGAAALGDYHADGPGVRRRIALADLPRPFATPSSRNGPSVADKPPGARPIAPPGFVVDLFAQGLSAPRIVRAAPNGDLFVAESAAGQVRVLRAAPGAAAVERTEIFAKGLDQPFGIGFFPPGASPRWVYVATNNAVVRFAYEGGDLVARGGPETVVPRLSGTSGGHWTRDLAFSPDGARMFVSVGSASNVAGGIAKAPPVGAPAWEASHGLGAAWGDEEGRAELRAFDPEGKGGRAFATGLRNCVGVAVQPATGAPFCTVNERDGLGDDLVPDYLTRVREGAFYGWPWYYLGPHEDPRHAGERPDLAPQVSAPDLLLQPHSAPLGLCFYEGEAFPPEYRGNAFVAFHGSWNRALRTGYKVVRALVDPAGAPTGEYEDFLTGFVVDDDHVWGRPVGVAVGRDGALFVSEDASGTLWRVAYAR